MWKTRIGYSGLKTLVIDINLSIFIIFKNDPSTCIVNTKFNIKYILYFCKTIFKDVCPLNKHLIIDNLLLKILNWTHQNFQKKKNYNLLY